MNHQHSPTDVAASAGTKQEQQLLLEWAWSQVEAMADGSLNSAQRQRMHRAMALDPQLQHAVQSARAVLRRLWGEPRGVVRWGLLGRLWRIPKGYPRERVQHHWPRWALAAACLGAVLVVALSPNTAIFQRDAAYLAQQQLALRDFDVAMSYMRKSAEISQRATGRSLGGGLNRALSLSWQTWITNDLHIQNGE